jgi:hypothetical protein
MCGAFVVTLISVLRKNKVIQLNFSSSSIFPGGIMEEWTMTGMAHMAYGIHICVFAKRLGKAHFYCYFHLI